MRFYLGSSTVTIHTTADPVNDTAVFPKAWPEKFAIGALAEPVDVEDLGKLPAWLGA